MLKKPRLSKEHSVQLAGLSVLERLNKLLIWKDKRLIDKKTYDYFVRIWKEKETKRATGPLFTPKDEKREGPSLAAEGDINCIIYKLYSRIKDYKISGVVSEYPYDDFVKFKKYVEKYYSLCQRQVNQMLILGMRVPDKSKRLTDFCRSWICAVEHRYFGDDLFWKELWQCRFVPHDAIDIMLTETENGHRIKSLFEETLIEELIPMIEIQRKYELWRVERAENEKEKSRRAKRLAAFDTLLNAAHEYCK